MSKIFFDSECGRKTRTLEDALYKVALMGGPNPWRFHVGDIEGFLRYESNKKECFGHIKVFIDDEAEPIMVLPENAEFTYLKKVIRYAVEKAY